MPSSVVEGRYNLNILITTILIKAKYDKRTTRRQKETAKITAQLSWKMTGLHV